MMDLEPRACLIGMSWGGFFSVCYTATYADCVDRIYLDAPLLTFHGFNPQNAVTLFTRRDRKVKSSCNKVEI